MTATEVVGEARRSGRARRSSAATEFSAGGEVFDDDAVVNGGERGGRGMQLDDGENL